MVLQGVGSSLLTHGTPTSGFRRLLWWSDESSERSNTETSIARKTSARFHDGDHRYSFRTTRRPGTTLVWSTRLTWCQSICCFLMDASRIRHLSLAIPIYLDGADTDKIYCTFMIDLAYCWACGSCCSQCFIISREVAGVM